MADCTNQLVSADTSQTVVRYLKEECWGEIAETGKMQELRITSESLGVDRSTTVSEEIRGDRQISDLIPTKVEASGDINGELSFGTYDQFIAAALCNDWKTAVNSVVTGVAVSSVGNLVYPGSTIPSFTVGQALKLSGFSNEKNNRIVVVKSINATTKTITVAPKLVTATASTSGVTAKGQAIVPAAKITSFTFEKEFKDVKLMLAYFGMTVNNMSISIENEAKIGITFSFLGSNGSTSTTTINPAGAISPANIIPATTTAVMSSSIQNGLTLENDKNMGAIMSMSLEVSNSLRGKSVFGKVGNAAVGLGRVAITGNISLYFENFDIYEKFLKNTSSSIIFSLGTDSEGDYIVHLPKIKFTEAKVVAGGPDQDVMVEGGYQALLDPTSGTSIVITKIPA